MGEAVQEMRADHEDLASALEVALKARTAVVQKQKQTLVSLKQLTAAGDGDTAKMQTRVTKLQKTLGVIQKKLVTIGKSCASTLSSLEEKRHVGHLEAHAVEIALKVLGDAK